MILLLLLAQVAVGPPSPDRDRWERCVDAATSDPEAAIAEAERWKLAGGGFLAQQCRGMAYARATRWESAAGAFEAAARDAELAKDVRSGKYWAQAGNAWIAAGDPAKARSALDAALASGALAGVELGEAHLDRARARVALRDQQGARQDLDEAVVRAAADPMAWLLSATLARRMGDVPLAQKHIATAIELAGDDAAVQLEVGNIAASARDEAGAKAAWAKAIQLAPGSEAAAAARAALAQFDAPGR